MVEIPFFYSSLTNKHVPVSFRLRLFKSVITPTMLYGLTTCPLTKHDYDQLAVLQRKMMRNIIGWIKLPDDDWDDVYRRLRHKLQNALRQYPIGEWTDELRRRKNVFQHQSDTGVRNNLTTHVINWDPVNIHDDDHNNCAKRYRGRPRQRWI